MRGREMAKTAITFCVILLILVGSRQVEADCTSRCNKECLDKEGGNKVICGIHCLAKCSGMFKGHEMKTKLREALQKKNDGEITPEVQADLREIVKRMMKAPAAQRHHA